MSTAVRDLLSEAAAGVAARPARLIMTTLGTMLGIAALVTTIGVSQTAAGQVNERFDTVQATYVTIQPKAREGGADDVQADLTRLTFDAPDRIERLAGVRAAGTFSDVPGAGQVSASALSGADGAARHDVPVAAASPELFTANRAQLATGRLFDAGHGGRGDAVVVIGKFAAERLGLNRVDSQPSIFIGNRPFTVIGILDSVGSRADLQDSVIMPNGTARAMYGLESPGAVDIRTQLGAAQQVAGQAPIAVGPNNPDRYEVAAPPAPGSLRDDVQADINILFLALGGVALLVGGVGIANITLLSVMERIPEIGLRRAVGATRPDIAGQFLIESATVGLLGGLIGAAAGAITTVAVAAAQDWTPLLDPRLPIAAPLLGALIGLVAGTYPAWRATTIEPITALRAQ